MIIQINPIPRIFPHDNDFPEVTSDCDFLKTEV